MIIASGKLTSKSQTTIPKKVRDLLKLTPGDRFDYIEEDGKIVIKPRNLRAADLFGVLKRKGQKPVSVEEMNKAVRKTVVERYERSLDRD